MVRIEKMILSIHYHNLLLTHVPCSKMLLISSMETIALVASNINKKQGEENETNPKLILSFFFFNQMSIWVNFEISDVCFKIFLILTLQYLLHRVIPFFPSSLKWSLHKLKMKKKKKETKYYKSMNSYRTIQCINQSKNAVKTWREKKKYSSPFFGCDLTEVYQLVQDFSFTLLKQLILRMQTQRNANVLSVGQIMVQYHDSFHWSKTRPATLIWQQIWMNVRKNLNIQ